MALCSYNFTLLITTDEKSSNKYSSLIKNTIKGLIGRFFDDLYVHKNVRTCTFRGMDVDELRTNETYYELFKNNLIDIFLDPSKIGPTKEYLEFSKTVSTTNLRLGQFLSEPNNLAKSDFSAFLFENLNLLIFILIGYLLLFIISFLFLRNAIHNSLKRLKLILFKLSFLDYNQLCAISSKIALVFLFFNLFLFILITVLTAFIKTEKVIVNCDEIINTDLKLIQTPKTLTLLVNDFDFFKICAKNSLLTRLIDKKIKANNHLILDAKGFSKLKQVALKKKLPSLFFLIEDHSLKHFISVFLEGTKDQVAFESANYFERLNAILFRKNLKKLEKMFINRR